MATKRPPNPYTKYGRKRIRNEMSEEDRKMVENIKAWIYVIIFVVGSLIVYHSCGTEGLIEWYN